MFLAGHVVGQIQPGSGVARCRWVPVASAPQTRPPVAAELIQSATTGTAWATIEHQPLDTVARLRVAREIGPGLTTQKAGCRPVSGWPCADAAPPEGGGIR